MKYWIMERNRRYRKTQTTFIYPKPELERSGMGFTVMETFMDDEVVSPPDNVKLIKYLGSFNEELRKIMIHLKLISRMTGRSG